MSGRGTGLRTAGELQRRAVADLQQARAGAGGWSDEQRRSADTQVLDPLAAEGKAIIEAISRAAQGLVAASRRLQG